MIRTIVTARRPVHRLMVSAIRTLPSTKKKTWSDKGAPGCSKCRHQGCRTCFLASQSEGSTSSDNRAVAAVASAGGGSAVASHGGGGGMAASSTDNTTINSSVGRTDTSSNSNSKKKANSSAPRYHVAVMGTKKEEPTKKKKPTWKEKGAPGCSKCRLAGCRTCFEASNDKKKKTSPPGEASTTANTNQEEEIAVPLALLGIDEMMEEDEWMPLVSESESQKPAPTNTAGAAAAAAIPTKLEQNDKTTQSKDGLVAIHRGNQVEYKKKAAQPTEEDEETDGLLDHKEASTEDVDDYSNDKLPAADAAKAPPSSNVSMGRSRNKKRSSRDGDDLSVSSASSTETTNEGEQPPKKKRKMESNSSTATEETASAAVDKI